MEENTDKSTDKRLKNLKPAWKKGESGNPDGHPKGQRNYSTIYREALIKLGAINNKTPEELETELIASGFAMAKKDYRFYKDVLDRIHGTATLKTDITSLGEKIGLTAEQQTKLDKLLNDK
jgi:hypothetical protein